MNSLSGTGSTQLGTVATVVAAANSAAMEASKEIEAAMRISMRAALGAITNKANECQMDDLAIMKVLFFQNWLLIYWIWYAGTVLCESVLVDYVCAY